MSEHIQFELVSPEEKLVSEPVRMAVIPGEEGAFGVLAGHSALVAALKPGVVELFGENDNEATRRIFIAGGFADVNGEQCTVLAEEAIDANALDQATLQQEISNLTEDLAMAKEDSDKSRIQKRLDLAQAKLAVLS